MHPQGPRLQNHQPALTVQGPFHILGSTEIGFQAHAIPGQQTGLGLGQARPLAAVIGHRNLLQLTAGIRYKLFLLGNRRNVQAIGGACSLDRA